MNINNEYQVLFTKDKVCGDSRPHKTTIETITNDKGKTIQKKFLVEFNKPIELTSIV